MRIAICDDEKKDLEQVIDLLNRYDSGNTFAVDKFTSADDFLKAVKEVNYDIALLDIEMNGTNGYEAARLLSTYDNHPLMIFITKSMKYTISGYGIVFRYLTKPLDYAMFSSAMDSAVREVNMNRFVFTIDGTAHAIKTDDIFYFEVYGHTTILHTVNDTFSIRSTLKDTFSTLPQGYFGMPHQSYLVNFNKISSYSSNRILLTNGAGIPVSRRRFKDFNKAFSSYLGR